MRNLILILISATLAVSCQIEDENAPSPEETFIKYFGELASYTANDIEIEYDVAGEATGLVVFGTKTTVLGDNDYFVLRTDLEGNLVDSTSFGFDNADRQDLTGDGMPDIFRGDETASRILPIPGGGYFTIGTSSITETVRDISDWRLLTIGFLDAELNLLNNDSVLALVAEPNNVDLDMIGSDIKLLSDGSLLIAGAIEVDRGGGISDFDNYYLKIDNNGNVVFENTQGVAGDGEDDILVRAFEKLNGSLVFIGYSNSPSLLGENDGLNGTNVYYLEVSSNGTPDNFAAYGFENPNDGAIYSETVSGAIQTASGFSVVGTSSTSLNQEFSFLMNLSNNGTFLSGNSFVSSVYNAEGSILETNGFGVTQASNNDVVMVGKYNSFATTLTSRGGEGMFVKFDEAAQPIVGAESFLGLADGDDSVVDAVTLPDGKIAAVANVDFGGGVRLISIIKLNDDGSLD